MIKFTNECTKRKRLKKERKNATVPNKLVYLKLFTGWLGVALPAQMASDKFLNFENHGLLKATLIRFYFLSFVGPF